MRIHLLLVTVVTALALTAGSAAAAPERTAAVAAGTAYTWSGAAETNANPYYFRLTGRLTTVGGQEIPPKAIGPLEEGRCGPEAYEQCDDILVELVNPLTDAEIASGKTSKRRSVTISVAESPERVADFDLQIFQSDADGTKGDFWTGDADGSQSGNFNLETPGESLVVGVQTTIDEPSRWMLIRVIRFASPNATYTGTVRF